MSQTVFLLLFLFLAARSQAPLGFNQSLLDAGGQDMRLSAPVSFFFELDPLAGLGTMVSTWTLKPALIISLIVLLAAVFLGRVFCGFACPFGAFNQLLTQAAPKRKLSEKAKLNRPGPGRRLKYYLLFFFLAAAALGSNQAGLLDPLSFFYRGLVLAVFPALNHLIGLVMTWLAEFPPPVGLLSHISTFVTDHVFGYTPRFYQGAFLLGALLILIAALNLWRPRFFCRNLCPLGALLGLFSRYGLYGLTKDENLCTNCGRCRAACPGASNPHPEDRWLRSECHVCFNCQEACPEGALKFKFQPLSPQPRPSPLAPVDGPDLGRRTVLASLAGGLTLFGLGRVSRAAPARPGSDLIRPPGSLAEKDFLSLCVRCGLCVRACPTNVLSPSLGEAGLEGLFTPVLKFDQGYCEYSCTLCSSVCPTGAIRLLTAREKTETPIRIGSSFFDRGRCLPWSGQGPCLVCEEHCPTSPKAIYLIPMEVRVDRDKTEVLLVPQVKLDRCVGCGVCSYKCPVVGRPAVYVSSVGETRSRVNQILLPASNAPGGDAYDQEK